MRAAEPTPQYGQERPRPRPVLDTVGPQIEALLTAWAPRLGGKQRVTAPRVHGQLVADGCQVGERTVRTYLAERRRQQQETYVPLVWRPGDAAQADFFEVLVAVAGQRVKVVAFVLRLMFSQLDFVCLYERQDQVSLLDGHVRAFTAMSGRIR